MTDTYRETRDVPLDDLAHFPGNAQKGDVEAIRASLRQHGQYRALIVRLQDDGQLVVLAGNHTLQALAAEGYATARCEIHVCDDSTALRINIADNKIASLGVWDDEALLEQLSLLDGDYTATGWTEGEVVHLLEVDTYTSDRTHEITGHPALGPTDEADDETPGPPAPRTPPAEFPSYDDDIDTQYACPKCRYEWSGKPK